MKKSITFSMSLFSAFLLWSMVEAHTQSTLKKVGDIAENFELTDVISGDSIRLHDYRGSIVLLDFFFYWWGICRNNSAVVEREIQEYYEERGGNPQGIPVHVIGLEKDDRGVSSGGSFFFAETTGLEVVLDDSNHAALHQFFPSSRGEDTTDSDFVLLNGVEGSTSHDAWEVLYAQSHRVNLKFLREKIDSIEPASLPVVLPTLANPRLIEGQFAFEIDGVAGQKVIVQTSSSGLQWNALREVTMGEMPVTFIEPIQNDSKQLLFRVVLPWTSLKRKARQWFLLTLLDRIVTEENESHFAHGCFFGIPNGQNARLPSGGSESVRSKRDHWCQGSCLKV